jgi:glycosyltransferase involved in cell wall biosynthesis
MSRPNSSTSNPNVTITVITVVKDNVTGLKKTLNSLKEQEYQDWQSIIVDGRSEDGSQKLARSYVDSDARFTLFIQESSGIYDAMNLALNLANGKYLWFLNSGDVFASSMSLTKACEIATSKSPNLLIGGYSYDERKRLNIFTKSAKWISPLEISCNRRGLCHQSMLYNKETLLQLGGYDTFYTLASDFHSALRISKLGTVYRTNIVFSKIELGGISQAKLSQVLYEKQQARRSVFGKKSLQVFLGFLWTVALRIKTYRLRFR